MSRASSDHGEVMRRLLLSRTYATTKLSAPHKTLMRGDESPTPGGDANGVGNSPPEMPVTKCGIPFARSAPLARRDMSVRR